MGLQIDRQPLLTTMKQEGLPRMPYDAATGLLRRAYAGIHGRHGTAVENNRTKNSYEGVNTSIEIAIDESAPSRSYPEI